jgi:uncharacterized phage protein (TIGR01671 family)
MRGIKFRAWDKEENRMIYDTERDSMSYWDWVTWTSVEIVNSQLRSNSYEWLQFTWLKDKNGKEIYEGDVVENKRNSVKDLIEDNTTVWNRWEVRFDNSAFRVHAFTLNQIARDLEIIWNIHENKELLTNE